MSNDYNYMFKYIVIGDTSKIYLIKVRCWEIMFVTIIYRK